MFRTFSFRSFRADDPILVAVDHLRALYGGRKLPAGAARLSDPQMATLRAP
jgi:hypothetical protein